MWKSLIVPAIRRLRKFGLYTIINLTGMIISSSVALVIFYISWHDLNVDHEVNNPEHVYRLIKNVEDAESDYRSAALRANFGPQLKNDLEGMVNHVIRVIKTDELISYRRTRFLEDEVYFVDHTFFEVFDFPFLLGNKKTALDDPNSIVITERTAKKYFGKRNPLNQTLVIEDGFEHVVTGVLKESAYKSHLKFDFIVPLKSPKLKKFLGFAEISAFDIYLDTKPNFSGDQVENRLARYSEDYYQVANTKIEFELQPVTNIYFDSGIRHDDAVRKDRKQFYALLIIAVCIIFLSSANFINLSRATADASIKNTRIRKALGATSTHLLMKDVLESSSVLLFSILVSGVATRFILIYLNNHFELDVPLIFNFELAFWLTFYSLTLILLCSLLPNLVMMWTRDESTEGYPDAARVLSKPVKLNNYWLLGAQFSIASVLIVYSLIIQEQFRFSQNKDLGFKSEEIVVFHSNNRNSYLGKQRIKEQISGITGVESVSIICGGLPREQDIRFQVEAKGSQIKREWPFALVEDYDFIDVIGLELIEGRDFSRSHGADLESSLILNETAIKELGWGPREAIGKELVVGEFGPNPRKVIGVVGDYHFTTTKREIEPLVIMPDNEWGETFLVNVASKRLDLTIKEVSNVWSSVAPKYPFTWRFLNDNLNVLYKRDEYYRNLLITFSSISVLIACLGVFGLSLFVMQRRSKEVTIRKVIGASTQDLIRLLVSRFMLLLLFSTILSWPFAWWFSSNWLNDFAYRINISWLTFILGSAMLFLLILLITGVQALKISRRSPVESLKVE